MPRTTRQLPCATVVLALLVSILVAACRRSSDSAARDDSHTSVPAGSAHQIVARGSAYAREQLGFRAPVLTYVLLACIDRTGALNPGLDECPGSMVATFAESGAPKGELAFIALGHKGMTGRRTPYGTAISFDPPDCTPSNVLAIAQARGVRWDRATTTSLSYAPRPGTSPAWTLQQEETVLLELSDAECVVAARSG